MSPGQVASAFTHRVISPAPQNPQNCISHRAFSFFQVYGYGPYSGAYPAGTQVVYAANGQAYAVPYQYPYAGNSRCRLFLVSLCSGGQGGSLCLSLKLNELHFLLETPDHSITLTFAYFFFISLQDFYISSRCYRNFNFKKIPFYLFCAHVPYLCVWMAVCHSS